MSRKIRFVLGIIALVIVIALCWFFLLSPLRADIAATEESIDAERTKLATAQAKLAQAEVTREEGKKNQARLLELAKMVPNSEEIPSLLIQIQDLADQSGIEFLTITPGDPLDSDGFRILPLVLEFSGTYFDLSDFVYRAEQMVAGPGRLLAVKQLGLDLGQTTGTGASRGTSASPELRVSMTLYAFETDSAAGGSQVPATGGMTRSAPSGEGVSSSTSPSGS